MTGSGDVMREDADDILVRLIYQHFDDKTAERLVITRWKDGIDVQYPTAAVKHFVEALSTQEKGMDDAAMRRVSTPAQQVTDEMVERALQGFDTGTGDPNDYRRRMRAALEAAALHTEGK